MQEIGVLGRPDETDQGAAFAQQGHLITGWTAHLEDDVGLGPEFGGSRHHISTRGAVAFVVTVGQGASTRLHTDPEAQLDQLLHNIRNGGNAFFTREYFLGNTNTLSFFSGNTGLHQATPQHGWGLALGVFRGGKLRERYLGGNFN